MSDIWPLILFWYIAAGAVPWVAYAAFKAFG
jgi:hypothetical protein